MIPLLLLIQCEHLGIYKLLFLNQVHFRASITEVGFASLWQLGSIVLTTQAHKTAKVTHANTVLSVIGRPTKTVATSTNCLCDLCKQTESRITNKTILKPSRPLPHENNLTNQLPFHASKTNDNQLANSSVTPYLLFSALQILSALSKSSVHVWCHAIVLTAVSLELDLKAICPTARRPKNKNAHLSKNPHSACCC